MNIQLIAPAHLGNKSGNSVTAVRWASILRELGHETVIAHDYEGEPADILIALNAYRSAAAVDAFRHLHPDRPLIVALTGTDLYRFAHSHPEVTLRSIDLADRLVALNHLVHKAVPETALAKLFLIYESACPLPRGRRPSARHFDVCVIGHLREEKDPLRTALAARGLPNGSRIRVLHFGAAHAEQWAQKARGEMQRNERYRWFGEVPRWRVRRALGMCHLMSLTSTMEGGPNTLSEAIVAGVPAISSDVDGATGVLGEDYPGYFPVGDTDALRQQLQRAETDPAFLEQLERYVIRQAPRFAREREKTRWEELLANLGFEVNHT